ncbi:MAG: cell division protein FtsB [Pseudomonadota bacterium]
MRLVNAILLVLLTLLQFKLWFGDGGVREMHQVQRMIETQESENRGLLERNKTLAAEVRDLKDGTEALEERARSELGMIGPDEEFIQIVSGTPGP